MRRLALAPEYFYPHNPGKIPICQAQSNRLIFDAICPILSIMPRYAEDRAREKVDHKNHQRKNPLSEGKIMITRQRIFPPRLLILLAAATILAGCGTGLAPVRGEDKNVFFPSVRVSYPLFDHDNLHGLSDKALEVDVSRGRGNGHQTINAGESLSFGGTTLSGPADIQQAFNLDVASAALRFRFPHDTPVFVELLYGVLYTDLDLRLQSGGFSAQQRFRDGGGIGGAGIGARVSDHLILDLRFILDLIPFNFDRLREMQSLDFSASYWLSPNVAVTGGYRHWKYSISRDGASDIDDLVWQGFAAGVALSF